MAIAVLMNIPNCTSGQYDQVIAALEQVNAGAPSGRLYHVAGPMDGGWRVLDVWESPESFQAFAQTLIPITRDAGIEPFQPDIYLVHNIITR